MEKKRQHVIPKCYQRPWCDLAAAANEAPYIWMISKEGQQKKRKAPEKAFVSSDAYTIRLADGQRKLVVEETLAKIEGKFVKLVERKIEKQYTLDSQDRADLCIFAAAMFARVDPQGRVYENFLQQIHAKVNRLEEIHNAQPRASLETAAMLENARPKYVATSVQMLAEMYFGMSLAVFVAPTTEHFITSDSPTVWYNPDAYKIPPFWRSPGLAQKKIEVTMPLTPRCVLYLSHNEKIKGYRQVPAKAVQEINRRTRFHCDQWFVSCKGEVRSEWFDRGTPPDDRW